MAKKASGKTRVARHVHEDAREQVPLSGMLAEFRTALQDEIGAVRRNEASSAVPLMNGRRIAQIGGSYQYVFDIENILNLPGDAPGDLLVPNKPRQEVVVVSVQGMAITLSVPMDLGPVVPNARLQSNMALLMRKLIERIEALANRPNPAGSRILGNVSPSGLPLAREEFLQGNTPVREKLNEEQIRAVASSLGRDTTFIWGPPGTGKTRTIGTIGEQLYRRRRPLLLVSHTNAAVDEAILRIADLTDSSELVKGTVLRVGDSDNPRFSDEKYRELLLKTHKDRRSQELAQRRDACEAELKAAAQEVMRLSRTIEISEWVEVAPKDIAAMARGLQEIEEGESKLCTMLEQEMSFRADYDKWSGVVEPAKVAANHLDNLKLLDEQIPKAKRVYSTRQSKLNSLAKQLSEAEALYAETVSVGWLTRKWRGLPSVKEQEQVVNQLRKAHSGEQDRLEALRGKLVEATKRRAALAAHVESFCDRYSTTPEEVLQKVEGLEAGLSELKLHIAEVRQKNAQDRLKLEQTLALRLAALHERKLTTHRSGPAEEMLAAIRSAHREASAMVRGADRVSLVQERNVLNRHIRSLETELQTIEEALKRVEELVIAEATIVATTLTRAYLRDSIQSRAFDTVILDEASMAPIPALWVAASLASKNAVVVGDFKQLPPIVISQSDLAKTWLGRDVFEVVGLNGTNDPTGQRVDLLEQWRMHPDISSIPNSLVYDQRLRDAAQMDVRGEDALAVWYRREWGHDCPVLLVDTGPVGAWVTSVSRGSRASRLNFLSATICVDIAEQLLRSDRPEPVERLKHRVIIVCPYRPHARLLTLLIEQQGLSKDVMAGTAHSFQGSEANVVILDLVNDEPHWRVGMFMPSLDGSIIPLLNVALTRAKRRLIVVGDFDYICKHAKKAFVGKKLIPFMRRHYRSIDARQAVPVGLAARAAKAQAVVIGEELVPDADRIVVNQERFYPALLHDIAQAQSRVVIYSPFITQDRLGKLEPQLRAATERGVNAYVITKALGDRPRRAMPTYRAYEQALADWGVVVVHKRRMHEKLVLVDADTLWTGSLNPLSFSDTQEIMERRRSEKVVKEYVQTLMLAELIGEYDSGTPSCPLCGQEMVATEGDRTPFYWLCTNEDCRYTRSVDQPRLTGGVITCNNCGGAVRHGKWGKKDVWRCVKNPRHRQRIAKIHLRLPKMRALVPEWELRRLDKLFGIEDGDSPKATQEEPQGRLFELKDN